MVAKELHHGLVLYQGTTLVVPQLTQKNGLGFSPCATILALTAKNDEISQPVYLPREQMLNRLNPLGLKPNLLGAWFAARLKSCPVTKLCFYPDILRIICATAVLLSTVLCAQQPSPSANEIAQRVNRHYNQLHSLRAGFTESYEGMGMRRTESGTLLLVKPGRMRWEYTQPAGKLFLLDGRYAWFYARGDSQVQRIPAKQLDDLRSPLRFLLGHTELEKELTGLKLATASKGQFTLTGQPKGQEKRVARLTLTVTAEGTITAIEMEEADGALTRFSFSNEQPNLAIAPSLFHFDPPSGLPVVDALPPV
jgi:outer membrane lipoprotein carrier protein